MPHLCFRCDLNLKIAWKCRSLKPTAGVFACNSHVFLSLFVYFGDGKWVTCLDYPFFRVSCTRAQTRTGVGDFLVENQRRCFWKDGRWARAHTVERTQRCRSQAATLQSLHWPQGTHTSRTSLMTSWCFALKRATLIFYTCFFIKGCSARF